VPQAKTHKPRPTGQDPQAKTHRPRPTGQDPQAKIHKKAKCLVIRPIRKGISSIEGLGESEPHQSRVYIEAKAFDLEIPKPRGPRKKP